VVSVRLVECCEIIMSEITLTLVSYILSYLCINRQNQLFQNNSNRLIILRLKQLAIEKGQCFQNRLIAYCKKITQRVHNHSKGLCI